MSYESEDSSGSTNGTNAFQRRYDIIFRVEEKLNEMMQSEGIATACEKQCIHCHVNSQKLGRTRS